MNYIEHWLEQLSHRDSLTLKTNFHVVGERDKNLGPRWEFAKIELQIKPASGFEVSDATKECTECRENGYLDAVVFGLLDVIMTDQMTPLYKIHVVFEKMECHRVNSSQMAFRHAGRDAGHKLIRALFPSTPPK